VQELAGKEAIQRLRLALVMEEVRKQGPVTDTLVLSKRNLDYVADLVRGRTVRLS
jgi:hypothetical protein